MSPARCLTFLLPSRALRLDLATCAGPVLGMSLRKVSYKTFFFSVFSRNQEKMQFQGSTIAIISAHVPGQHMWARAGPGTSSSSPNYWKSDGRVKTYNSSARDRH